MLLIFNNVEIGGEKLRLVRGDRNQGKGVFIAELAGLVEADASLQTKHNNPIVFSLLIVGARLRRTGVR